MSWSEFGAGTLQAQPPEVFPARHCLGVPIVFGNFDCFAAPTVLACGSALHIMEASHSDS